MNRSHFRRYRLLCLAGVAAASAYPLYMGVFAIVKMAQNGFVSIEEYPKYVIPYTPISVALLLGVLTMPLWEKLSRKHAFPCASLLSLAIFLGAERLMETKILVQTQELVPLESWQLSLCYVPPEYYVTRTWEAVDVLLGGYSPAFKLHFYLISAAIILSALNCFYGFARMIQTGDSGRKKALILQAAVTAAFVGMCIWACFTAFYRSGEMIVSPLSAVLMAVFFVLLGVLAGVFCISFTLGKKRLLSVLLPTGAAVLVTLAMYIGEMALLSGNLYRFGRGFFFEGLGRLVFAPADLLVVAASGAVTYLICRLVNRGPKKNDR